MAILDNGQIFDMCDIVYRRETEGNRISPTQIERILQVCSLELFNVELPNFDMTRKMNKSMVRHRTTVSLTVSAGDATYPSDYCRPVLLTTSSLYPVNIIDERDNELYNRINDEVFAPTITNPIAILKNGLLSFLPIGITTPVLTYLAYPATPVFDWVKDSNDVLIYMPVGSSILLDGTTLVSTPNLVTNPNFTGSASGWTLGADWSYSANSISKAGTGVTKASQTLTLVTGATYTITYTITALGGTLTMTPYIGGTAGVTRTTTGTFTENIIAGATGLLEFVGSTGTTATIDNVEVHAVYTTLATYVTHPTATTFPYNSTSVDLDWNTEDRERILPMILTKLGVNQAPMQVTGFELQQMNRETANKFNRPQAQ